jgi:hypothetical protein
MHSRRLSQCSSPKTRPHQLRHGSTQTGIWDAKSVVGEMVGQSKSGLRLLDAGNHHGALGTTPQRDPLNCSNDLLSSNRSAVRSPILRLLTANERQPTPETTNPVQSHQPQAALDDASQAAQQKRPNTVERSYRFVGLQSRR